MRSQSLGLHHLSLDQLVAFAKDGVLPDGCKLADPALSVIT
jgi:hypothetical protein